MSVVMCKWCARGINYSPEVLDEIPDTHADVGESCPTIYAE